MKIQKLITMCNAWNQKKKQKRNVTKCQFVKNENHMWLYLHFVWKTKSEWLLREVLHYSFITATLTKSIFYKILKKLTTIALNFFYTNSFLILQTKKISFYVWFTSSGTASCKKIKFNFHHHCSKVKKNYQSKPYRCHKYFVIRIICVNWFDILSV